MKVMPRSFSVPIEHLQVIQRREKNIANLSSNEEYVSELNWHFANHSLATV